MKITPDTKLSKLLEAYPWLEDVLISISPTFAKLKNPLLRKTVAKVATLQQVANVGNISVSELVNKLRSAVGIEEEITTIAAGDSEVGQPAWFDEGKVLKTIDVDGLLDQGKHPLEFVGAALKEPGDLGILKLTASFMPDPLIEKFRSRGYRIWVRRIESGSVECFLTGRK